MEARAKSPESECDMYIYDLVTQLQDFMLYQLD